MCFHLGKSPLYHFPSGRENQFAPAKPVLSRSSQSADVLILKVVFALCACVKCILPEDIVRVGERERERGRESERESD